jgi:3-hydroxybutyryl-CoA dehydratase
MDFDKINVGDEIPVEKNPVGKYQPMYYAGASGDFNPIHIDPEFGKMVGLGGNILQGLCTMAFAAKAVWNYAEDPGALKKLKVRFAKPVKPLDTVVVTGKVIAKEGDTVTIEVGAITSKGDVEVLTNSIAELRRV